MISSSILYINQDFWANIKVHKIHEELHLESKVLVVKFMLKYHWDNI